jgi:hypothetical protein
VIAGNHDWCFAREPHAAIEILGEGVVYLQDSEASIDGVRFWGSTWQPEFFAYQAALSRYAHDSGCWPTVGNPGADTPGRYFAAGAADMIVVHEGGAWPKEERLKGDYFGGYADFPPFTRGVLVHSQPKIDRARLRMVRQYARWVYVTEAPYRPGDDRAANPWGRLSEHLEELCVQLSEK